ncbi:MAG: hypothetical protein ACTSQY_01200 [Candidatus Odinarchaeia archaeon]
MYSKTITAFCEECNKYIRFELNKKVEVDQSGLATYYYEHGDPKHTLIVYLDRFYTVRGECVIREKEE